MKTNRILSVLMSAALLALSACSPAPTALPTALPTLSLEPTQIPTKVKTPRPEPSGTLPPSSSPRPSDNPTLAPSATQPTLPTGTPRPSFAGFQVEFVEYSASYGMQFAFIIPGIRQNYGLDVNGKAYNCNYYEKYPDRLFCTGPVFTPRTVVKLSFLTLDGAKQEVYSSSYVIPGQTTPTIDPTVAKSFNPENCPVRGVNVHCETEYRVLGSGCCVVSTCVDACGYYYSVNTCPEGMTWQGICQGTPPVTPPVP